MDSASNSNEPTFKYVSEGAEVANQPTDSKPTSENTNQPTLTWAAPDSFSAKKTPGWYLVLLAVTVGIAAVVYFPTKDVISTAAVLVCGLLFGFYGGKKPPTIHYQLSKDGYSANNRYHSFADYRSFSVIKHKEGLSIVLTPLKRFKPYSYINVGRDLESKVSPILNNALPNNISRNDSLDNFLRKIGF